MFERTVSLDSVSLTLRYSVSLSVHLCCVFAVSSFGGFGSALAFIITHVTDLLKKLYFRLKNQSSIWVFILTYKLESRMGTRISENQM